MTGAGFHPSPDQLRERKALKPGERCGFDFQEHPDPKCWTFAHCTEWREVGEEAACAGCEGWGMECWSVWAPRSARRG